MIPETYTNKKPIIVSYNTFKADSEENRQISEEKSLETTKINTVSIFGDMHEKILLESKSSNFKKYKTKYGCRKRKLTCQNNQQEDSYQISDMEQQIKCGKNRPIKKGSQKGKNKMETRNMNRHFRSKINEMLKQIIQNTSEERDIEKASQVLKKLNRSHKIMFSQMREILMDSWLRQRFDKNSSILLKYIHRAKMGTKSKLVMLKYFNRIKLGIKYPEKFFSWK